MKHRGPRGAWILIVALVAAWGCNDAPDARPEDRVARPQGVPQTRDLETFGRDLDAAVRVHDLVYQARGTGNVQMVATGAGNVIIDTGLVTEASRLKPMIDRINDDPTTHVIVTHAHPDHYSAADDFAEGGAEIVAHREFLHNQTYLKALVPFLMPRNRIFFPEQVPVPRFADRAVQWLYPVIEPTIVVDDEYAFEIGGVRFEVLSMPGAEGSDGLCVWLPQHRILFTGDLFGHVFGMWPNLTTIRGERTRFPLPYIESLDRILELDPVLLVPSHFEPITGRDRIRAGVIKTRDAVQYVHDRVIEGMNDGKDVYTLMREIRLPEELQLPEIHGKVAWGVRSIWEGYSGWFRLDSTAELYGVTDDAVYPDVVELAGGVDAINRRAALRLERGEPAEAIRLLDIARSVDPRNRRSAEIRLAALEELLERSGDVNHYEVYWLRHRIRQTRELL